jgi:hypothetical protein
MDLLGHITLRPGGRHVVLHLHRGEPHAVEFDGDETVAGERDLPAEQARSSQSNEIDPRRMVVITRN